MNKILMPKKIMRDEEVVVIPKKEYDRLLAAWQIAEFAPTKKEKNDLARARKNRAAGNFLTLHELKQKLGFAS